MGAAQAGGDVAIADLVGRGELRARRHGQKIDRRRARAIQVGLRAGDVEVDLGVWTAPAEIGEHILQVRRLQVAPAVLMQRRASDVDRDIVGLSAILEFTLQTSERAGGRRHLGALIGEAVPEPHIQRAARRVQAEHGVGAHEIDPVDGDIGQKVPVDRVAELLAAPAF